MANDRKYKMQYEKLCARHSDSQRPFRVGWSNCITIDYTNNLLTRRINLCKDFSGPACMVRALDMKDV